MHLAVNLICILFYRYIREMKRFTIISSTHISIGHLVKKRLISSYRNVISFTMQVGILHGRRLLISCEGSYYHHAQKANHCIKWQPKKPHLPTTRASALPKCYCHYARPTHGGPSRLPQFFWQSWFNVQA